MRRRDHYTIGKSCLASAVICNNRVRNNRRWGVFIFIRHHDFHPACRQHFKRAGKSRHGECMCVHAEKQRTIDLLLFSVDTNGLTDGEDMPFIECFIEG